jgi:hypothetical protein
MMTLSAEDDVAQDKCNLNELARLLSLLSNDEVNDIICQSAIEVAAAQSKLVAPHCRSERTRSSSECSPAGSPRRYNNIWEMQAPVNTFNLAGLLSILDDCDESCIITVRKIHRLGFKSARALRKHFQPFGPIDKLLLA